jgi:FkbM family methyltransferase
MRKLIVGLLPPGAKSKLKGFLHIPDMEFALDRLRRVGFRPAAAVDVGANVGDWSRMCRRVFGAQVPILAIEPQDRCQPALHQMERELGRITIAKTLLGARQTAAVPFYVHDFTGISSVLREPEADPVGTVPVDMITLDELIANTDFPRPELLKLDVQGYELEVLRGGAQTLAGADVVLMEVNLLPIYEGAPLLHETVAFMADAGFRAYDFCSAMRRPLDDALFQTDMLFVRHDSSIIASKRWK